jgi:hypothetical protein
VVQEPVQHGGGRGAIVVKVFGPVFIGLVGGQQDGALLVTLADFFAPISTPDHKAR